jgi:outer membrane scaffolding protein for murein synthesis (MipA/OmpV family)
MKRSFVFLSAIFLSTLAYADSGALTPMSAGERSSASTEKEIVLGIGAGPAYPGAYKRYGYIGLAVEANFGNGVFVSSQDGIGYRFLETPSGFSMAASLGVLPGREEKDGRNDGRRNLLAGMGDIGARGAANLMLNYDSGPLHGRATLTHALGSRNDTLFGVDGSYDLYADSTNLVRVSTGFLYGNRSTMQTYFGVTPQQSANSGNPVYTPGSGIGEMHAALNWRHAFSEHWVGTVGAGVTSLRKGAADSPLVERRNSGYAAVTLGYRF